jgi:hypothetical protein
MKPARRAACQAVVRVAKLRASPVADAELEWFFNLADSDMGDVSNFGRLLPPVDEEGERRTMEDHAEAAHAYRVIRGWLRAIPDSDAGVLQTAYEPRCWPRAVRNELGLLSGIAVRLMVTPDEWPEDRRSQHAMDSENARELADMCVNRGPKEEKTLQRLRFEAQGRFARSVAAYEKVRGGGRSVVSRFGRQR